MISAASSEFLKEFTLFAERDHDEKETLIIQRANGKNAVFMSMDTYNALQKELFGLRQKNTRT
mgnify:CR=1 FL=1